MRGVTVHTVVIVEFYEGAVGTNMQDLTKTALVERFKSTLQGTACVVVQASHP